MLPKLLAALALTALALIAAPRASEAATPDIVSALITPFVANIGGRMTLTIVVQHDPGTTISGPAFDDNIGALELLSVGEPVMVETDVGATTTLVYTLTSFRIGPGAIPSIELTWREAGASGIIRTPDILYAVDSVLQPGDDSLRPLKAQLAIPQPAPPPFVPAALMAMMALLTACGYWLMRQTIALRPPTPAPAYLPTPISPARIAREELDAVTRDGLARTDPAAYYANVAGAVRRYLSRRFGFPAFALTRREIAREMERAGIDRWPARLTENLLDQSAAAEFAQFEPAPERRDQDLAAAYEIIDLTSADDEPGT